MTDPRNVVPPPPRRESVALSVVVTVMCLVAMVGLALSAYERLFLVRDAIMVGAVVVFLIGMTYTERHRL